MMTSLEVGHLRVPEKPAVGAPVTRGERELHAAVIYPSDRLLKEIDCGLNVELVKSLNFF